MEAAKSSHDAELESLKDDMKEMQSRHAEELEERDGSVSDAEAVLLMKEEKIDQLEEELTLTRDRQTVQLNNMRSQMDDDFQAAVAANAKEMEQLKLAHAEELKHFQQDIERSQSQEIDQLKEELRQTHDRQTVQLNNMRSQFDGDMKSIIVAHAEEMEQLKLTHVEELKCIKQEMERHYSNENSALQERIDQLDNIISQGRLVVDNLKSDLHDCEHQLEQVESNNARLQQEMTDLQSCLDTTTQEAELLRAELHKQHDVLQSKSAAEQKLSLIHI